MSGHSHPVDPDGVATARVEGLAPADAQMLASLAGLLADPMRPRLLAALLATGELCVGDLGLAVDATQDSVTYALRILRTAGLVRRRRRGRMVFYGLRSGAEPLVETSLVSLGRLARFHGVYGPDDATV